MDRKTNRKKQIRQKDRKIDIQTNRKETNTINQTKGQKERQTKRQKNKWMGLT